MKVTEDNQYPGGKGVSGLAEWILRQLPSHTMFLEPYAGKAAVTRAKSPALKTLLCELDPEVVEWLKRECPYAVSVNCDGMTMIAQLAVGSVDHWPANLLVNGVDRPSSWEVIPAAEEVVIYCDPPYLLTTRTKTKIYDYEWPEDQHVQFLRLIQRVPCPVAISGYDSPLYREALNANGWTMTSRMAQTRGGLRQECLWRNPLCVDTVARGSSTLARGYSALGQHWRERDNVNRLVNRWAKNFAKRPQYVRDAIIRRLMDEQRNLNGEG